MLVGEGPRPRWSDAHVELLLDAVRQHGGLTAGCVTEVAEAIGKSKATVYDKYSRLAGRKYERRRARAFEREAAPPPPPPPKLLTFKDEPPVTRTGPRFSNAWSGFLHAPEAR